jgi:hypothetical protein
MATLYTDIHVADICVADICVADTCVGDRIVGNDTPQGKANRAREN